MATALATQSFKERLQAKAEREAQEAQLGSYPPRIQIVGKKDKKAQAAVVKITYPDIKDDNGDMLSKEFETVRGVLLGHFNTREIRYRTLEDKWKSEYFAVGSKRDDEPEIEITHLPYGSNTPETKKVSPTGRYVTAWLLDPATWVDKDKPLVALGTLSMSSTYGISIDKEDAEDMALTLLGFPFRGISDAKGVLHTLKTRPWELMDGTESQGTPHEAIWIEIGGAWLGTQTPTHAFTIMEELDESELAIVEQVLPQAQDMLRNYIVNGVKAAYPGVTLDRLESLTEMILDTEKPDYDAFNAGVSRALPAEVVSDVPVNTPQAQVAVSDDEAAMHAAFSAEDEFPPEDDLPF